MSDSLMVRRLLRQANQFEKLGKAIPRTNNKNEVLKQVCEGMVKVSELLIQFLENKKEASR